MSNGFISFLTFPNTWPTQAKNLMCSPGPSRPASADDARAGAWLPPQVLGAGAVCWKIHPTAVEWANASATFEPHEILGVAWDASERVLRTAYRRLALEHHPDQGGCEETMARLNHARDVLCDPVSRRNHDRELDGV